MFSKALELAGLSLVAVAIGYWSRWEAGVLFGGLALVFVASTIDDAELGRSVRRGFAWIRYSYWKTAFKETVAANSPHPEIRIDPESQAMAERMARAREERSKLGDRTQALSKQDYDDLERLG